MQRGKVENWIERNLSGIEIKELLENNQYKRVVTFFEYNRPDDLKTMIAKVSRNESIDSYVDDFIKHFNSNVVREIDRFVQTEIGEQHVKYHLYRALLLKAENVVSEAYTRSLPPFPRLPKLTIERGAYCSQSTVDTACDLLQDNWIDVYFSLLCRDAGTPERLADSLQNVWESLLEEEEKGEISLPETNLGMIDLNHELLRRVRQVLSSSQDNPSVLETSKILVAPLSECDVLDSFSCLEEYLGRTNYFTKDTSLTLDSLKEILSVSFRGNPDLWYELYEDIRLDLHLSLMILAHKTYIESLSLPVQISAYDIMTICYATKTVLVFMSGMDHLGAYARKTVRKRVS